jgi:hypothetical protein
MTVAKRKVSVSLDADLVEELARADEALSQQVNDAVRETLERRRRRRLLGELLVDLAKRSGPAPARLIAKYEELLA